MEKKEQKKRIAANTLYTMGGLIFMNGVLQLIITPLLNRYMGAKQLGELLYITGLVAIICPSVGQALNTSRLVVRRSHEVTNGDYDWILLLFGVLGSGVALFMSRDSISGIPVGIGVFALFLLTVFRYYGDVEYRLNLNYQRYFIYYLLIGIGYLAGFVIYRITDQWLWIYLVGEVAALCYVAVTGSVFHKFFQRSGHFFVALERGFFLTLSYLITNTTMNMDRLDRKDPGASDRTDQYDRDFLSDKTQRTVKQKSVWKGSACGRRCGRCFFPWLPGGNTALCLAVLP